MNIGLQGTYSSLGLLDRSLHEPKESLDVFLGRVAERDFESCVHFSVQEAKSYVESNESKGDFVLRCVRCLTYRSLGASKTIAARIKYHVG